MLDKGNIATGVVNLCYLLVLLKWNSQLQMFLGFIIISIVVSSFYGWRFDEDFKEAFRGDYSMTLKDWKDLWQGLGKRRLEEKASIILVVYVYNIL